MKKLTYPRRAILSMSATGPDARQSKMKSPAAPNATETPIHSPSFRIFSCRFVQRIISRP